MRKKLSIAERLCRCARRANLIQPPHFVEEAGVHLLLVALGDPTIEFSSIPPNGHLHKLGRRIDFHTRAERGEGTTAPLAHFESANNAPPVVWLHPSRGDWVEDR